MMDCYPEVVDNKMARKRRLDAQNWQRNRAKQKRYGAKRLPVKPTCSHRNRRFQCSEISMSDIRRFHYSFYAVTDKLKQDSFLLKHVKAEKIKRRRPRANSKNYKARDLQLKYQVYCRSEKKMVLVCQKAFLELLDLKRYRVENVIKNYYLNGKLPTENRGGDHKSHKYKDKKTSVINFIKSLKCSEPHYCRGNTKRLYLPSDLSVNKLAKMYNTQASERLKVKSLYFRKIFNTSFNLSFGSPRVDVCSTCLRLSEQLKNPKSESEKIQLMAEKLVHKRRARAFFEMLKEENPTIKILSFDCQKNMVLPKIPDQSTYYSRQLYFFNFVIVEGTSKSPLTKNNVVSYCWTEDQYAKDSNLIVSCVYHRLCNTEFSSECATLRLVADGCSGQNKNSMLLAMLSKWLTQDAPTHIKLIEVVFPVVGHSFLPPDRVFGRIEKDLRKMENILEPKEYMNVINQHSTVINVASECQIWDWKTVVKNVFLKTGKWHVPFIKCKRFYLKRAKGTNNMVGLKGELHYRTNLGHFKSVCQKGKNMASITLTAVSQGVNVKALKLRDVNKLLRTHFGSDWRNLQTLEYYAKIMPLNIEAVNIEEVNIEENDADGIHDSMCEEQEESPLLLV